MVRAGFQRVYDDDSVRVHQANNNMVELVICNNDGMAEGRHHSAQDRRLQRQRGQRPSLCSALTPPTQPKELIAAGSMVGSIKQDAEGMAAAIALLPRTPPAARP